MSFVKATSPHIRRKDSNNWMMADVLIALVPVIIYSLVVYGLSALRNLLVSLFVMEAAEAVSVIIREKSIKKFKWMNGLSAGISATIFALLMPANYDSYYIAYVALIFGALFGIVIAKLLFGGTGSNIFNPAAAGFIFAKISFGAHYRVANYTTSFFTTAGATFLHGDFMVSSTYNSYSLLDLFLGKTPGLMGEACKLAILIGLVYLLIRRSIEWRVVVSFLATFLFMTFFAGIVVQVRTGGSVNIFEFMMYQLLSGGVLFGMVYMITDPVTSPISKPSRILYGMIIAAVCVLIRLGARQDYVHEGMAFSILIGNMVSPILDYWKWSTNQYTKKNIIPMIVIPTVATIVLVLIVANRTITSDAVIGGATTVKQI